MTTTIAVALLVAASLVLVVVLAAIHRGEALLALVRGRLVDAGACPGCVDAHFAKIGISVRAVLGLISTIAPDRDPIVDGLAMLVANCMVHNDDDNGERHGDQDDGQEDDTDDAAAG